MYASLSSIANIVMIQEGKEFQNIPPMNVEMIGQYIVHNTYHATLQVNPGKLIFSQDILLNVDFVADLESKQTEKAKWHWQNSTKKNDQRINHDYQARAST